MASYNRVILVGNVTRDPDLRYTPSGTAVTDLGLAVNDRRKSQSGEWIEETTFVDITLWARTAEIAAEYARKGAQVMIEGRLQLDQWEQDGKKRSKLKVVGERLVLLGSRSGGGGDGGGGGGGGGRPPQQQGGGADYQSQSQSQSQSQPPPDNYDGGQDAGGAGDDIPF